MRLASAITILFLIGCSSQPESAAPSGRVELPVIATGDLVEIDQYVEEGRVTVFDFYADWCPPCIKLDETLTDMKATYGDGLEVYKLDVVSWDSDLAKGFGIKDLPYMIVYGPDGKLLHEGPANQYMTRLVKLLNRSQS